MSPAAVGGGSKAGKNFPLEMLLVIMPAESLHRVTSASDKALIYEGGIANEDELKHTVIYLPEIAPLIANDKEGQFLQMLRVLISENRIDYSVVEGDNAETAGRSTSASVDRLPSSSPAPGTTLKRKC